MSAYLVLMKVREVDCDGQRRERIVAGRGVRKKQSKKRNQQNRHFGMVISKLEVGGGMSRRLITLLR